MSRDKNHWRERLRIIIFEADTYWGKRFDVVLLIAILLSVAAVMLESVKHFKEDYSSLLYAIEWFFTILFLIEYIARLISSKNPWNYAFSFFGIIDLLSILPTFASIIFSGAHSLLIIRSIRLLRVFRVLKMVRFIGEATQLGAALRASRIKITVFIGVIFISVVIMGTLMYLVEGAENGFTSIPVSIYWAVVTLTTVGYGDIAPQTIVGQSLATIIMILGYGIIAVPTGIVSAEMSKGKFKVNPGDRICPKCTHIIRDPEANYCGRCSERL